MTVLVSSDNKPQLVAPNSYYFGAALSMDKISCTLSDMKLGKGDESSQDSLCSITDHSASSLESILGYSLSSLQTLFSEDSTESQAKRVRFQVDDEDCIVVSKFEYSTEPLDDMADVYTTGREAIQNRRMLRKDMQLLAESNTTLIAVLESSRFGRRKEVHTSKQKYEARVFLNWAGSDLRGFEDCFSVKSTQHIQSYVSLVTSYYRGLKSIIGQGGDELYDVDELLRSRIVERSARSRQFAAKMAVADEIVARKISKQH